MCGGPLVIGGAKNQLRCSVNREPGTSACANGRGVKCEAVETRVVEAVKGLLLQPEVIEEALREFGELQGEFEIVVRKERHMDELIVRVEAPEREHAGLAVRVRDALRAKIGLRPTIEFCPPGSLARTDLKSRRVRDER